MALFSDNHANPPNHRWQNPALKEHFTRGTTHFIEKRRVKLLLRLTHARESRAGLSTPLLPRTSRDGSVAKPRSMLNIAIFDPWQRSLFSCQQTPGKEPLLAGKWFTCLVRLCFDFHLNVTLRVLFSIALNH